MKHKWKKLCTTLLMAAMVFTLLVPPTALAEETGTAATAAQGTAVADPVTITKWFNTQGNNTATMGRIWSDKSVSTSSITTQGNLTVSKEDGSDFLVALSALSSTQPTETEEVKPLDIVMVLDVSGSMDDGGKMTSLKEAANKFVDSTNEANSKVSDDAKKSRISIVKFAGNKSDRIGNETYRSGPYTYNYSQVVCNFTTNASTLQSNIDALKPSGSTRADYGLEYAAAQINKARTDVKKVVIFFTDGSPTSSNGFESQVANDAINQARTIKNTGAVIYAVGIFNGANVSDITGNENKYMNAVSSNYPSASSKIGGGGTSLPDGL